MHFATFFLVIEIKENLNGKRLLLSVSGGLDSICLLHFFKNNFSKLGLSEIAVAHVDHALRGEDSEKDGEFVKNLCEKWEIQFYFKSLKGELKKGSNLESRAREERYIALRKFKEMGNYDLLLTAHHQKDQAETAFMRLSRGTSIFGLRSIQKIRDDGIYRPFLEIPREHLEEYAQKHQLSWREDLSNKDTAFKRNKIRHKIFPFLIKEYPNFERDLQNLPKLAEKAYKKIHLQSNNLFEKLIIPEINWPFPKEFNPYKKTLCLNYDSLLKTIKNGGMGEIFRLWLSEEGFRLPLGEKGNILYPLPQRRLEIKDVLIEKSGNRLWFFYLPSFSPPDNLYLYNAFADSSREWRFRQDGDFYLAENPKGKRRKWAKWLQEQQIPPAVRDFLPILSSGSRVIRMGKPEDFRK